MRINRWREARPVRTQWLQHARLQHARVPLCRLPLSAKARTTDQQPVAHTTHACRRWRGRRLLENKGARPAAVQEVGRQKFQTGWISLDSRYTKRVAWMYDSCVWRYDLCVPWHGGESMAVGRTVDELARSWERMCWGVTARRRIGGGGSLEEKDHCANAHAKRAWCDHDERQRRDSMRSPPGAACMRIFTMLPLMQLQCGLHCGCVHEMCFWFLPSWCPV